MRKRILLGIFVFGILLFALVIKQQSTTTLLGSDNQKNDQLNFALSSPSHKLVDLSLTPHEPIMITHDNNFTDYGFPGLGTEEEPYVIENYAIVIIVGKGISIENTTKYFVVRNCYVDAGSSGIYLSNIAEGTACVENNNCVENISGISIENSPGATIINNYCENSTYGNGIHVSSSPNTNLTNNTCFNNYWTGIQLDYSSGSTVTNNTCINHWDGICLFSSSGVTVTNNTCINNNYGIHLKSSSVPTITNNTCINSVFGIYMDYSSEATVTNNNCSDNSFGIQLDYSSVATVTNNTCNNNVEGISLISSPNSTLTQNICKNNELGISLAMTHYCLITYNFLQENEDYGILLKLDIDNNIIHHNTLIDNNLGGTSQAYDSGVGNVWYDSKTEEGNYWSEWNSKKPYPIDGNANTTDPYPLNEELERINYGFIMIIPSMIFTALLCNVMRKRKQKCIKL
ncbi:MAG: right-handed parallel beta-helix repeat-containing protein [Candidatus Heimdallarchaeaceae archaeon]